MVWVENRVRKISEKVNSSSWRDIPWELKLTQLHVNVGLKRYHSNGFMVLNLQNHRMKSNPYLKQYQLVPPEVRIEELKTKLTVNALSMTKSNESSIGKIIGCKRFSYLKKLLIVSALVLRFV